MRRVFVWLFGVPIALVFLTAWSRPSDHYVHVVKAPVVGEQQHRR